MTTDDSVMYGASSQGCDMTSLGRGLLSASLASERPMLDKDGDKFKWTDHALYTGFSKFEVKLEGHPESLDFPVAMRDMTIETDAQGETYIEVKHQNHTYRLTSLFKPVPDNFSLDKKTWTFQMMVDVSRTTLPSRWPDDA